MHKIEKKNFYILWSPPILSQICFSGWAKIQTNSFPFPVPTKELVLNIEPGALLKFQSTYWVFFGVRGLGQRNKIAHPMV